MTNTSNILQGLGLFACVGGIILVVLIFLAVRAFTSRGRNNATPTSTTPSVFNQEERGHERPTYDSQRVESRGGFGGDSTPPQTSSRARVYEPRPSSTNQPKPSGSIDLHAPNRETPQRPQRPQRDRNDDDNVRSGGGFGS